MVELAGYEGLKAAILWQAIKDYQAAKKAKNRYAIKECEKFFSSKWFSMLYDIDAADLIKKIDGVDGKRLRLTERKDKLLCQQDIV